ncbi:MAG: hypothetical protein KME28_20390 [Pelatocladus maniniholoensis HA4357-MV3]|uniref:Uncharacterized protein n=1 Tax=Pelatocladus maniniholoensis HA4357-MV3 TaxID=1117104 RepID=A0A9E3HAX2_9NOST|nr:hypothetical protein [Pelatocladus maniniholoensis HA4357-MV3]
MNPQPHDTHPDVAGRFVEGKGVVRTESNEELLLRMRERYHEHPLPAVMPNLMVGSRDARIPEEVLHRYQKEVGKNNTNPYKNIPTTQKIRVDGVVMCALEASQIWEEKQATRKMTNTLLAGHYEAKRIQQENLVEANRTVSTLNTALVNQYANLTEEQLQAVVAAQENAIIKLLMPKLTELVNEIIRGKV